jgi:hypothetical protein
MMYKLFLKQNGCKLISALSQASPRDRRGCAFFWNIISSGCASFKSYAAWLGESSGFFGPFRARGWAQ